MGVVTDLGISRRKRSGVTVSLKFTIDTQSRDLDAEYDLPDGVSERMLADCLATLADYLIMKQVH